MNQQFPSYPYQSQPAAPPQAQPVPPAPYYPQQPVQAQPQQPNSPSLHQLRYHNRQLQRPQVILRKQPSNYPFSNPHPSLSSQQPSRRRQRWMPITAVFLTAHRWLWQRPSRTITTAPSLAKCPAFSNGRRPIVSAPSTSTPKQTKWSAWYSISIHSRSPKQLSRQALSSYGSMASASSSTLLEHMPSC